MPRHVSHVVVPWNFEDGQPFELEPNLAMVDDAAMAFIVDEVVWGDDELPRIMTGAVALYAEGKGTFMQCLETAIIWERG